MTGFVECFGKSSKLRELVNLVVVGGYIDIKKSRDREEMGEIEKMHGLIEKYKLHGQFRWIKAQMNRARNGELYRYIADVKGAFMQVADREKFLGSLRARKSVLFCFIQCLPPQQLLSSTITTFSYNC